VTATTSTRMTQSEARAKLLHAALAQLARDGIQLSVHHLGYEDLIKEAGVPRSTAYRIWGSKEEFFDAVLTAIPGAQAAERDSSTTLSTAARSIEAMQARLASAAGRREILVEMIRTAATFHFENVTSTQEWRNWISVCAGMSSLPTEVRQQITAEVQAQEFDRIDTIATFYRRVATVLGLRMRPEFGGDFRVLSLATGVFMEGLGVARMVAPEESAQTFTIDGRDWSIASIGFGALFDRFVEADPEWKGFRAQHVADRGARDGT
jgi:AcrR family transcriptional regulator